MSGLMEDLRTYSAEDQASIAHVEMLLMQRRVRYYPSTLSTLAAAGEITSPPCTDPAAASTSHPTEIHS
ncbi:MAG: hypothetical protein ACREPQ_09790 [Rhodanobacter sp.]